MTSIRVDGVDWKLLCKQKEWLVELMERYGLGSLDLMFGSGIIHLLDDIQDQAAEKLGEEIVFGGVAESG